MKKKLALSISIPTPCHENWDKMTPNEKGRHCASCNKTVIDFSDYSDRQLIEFFSKLNGSVCGRLTSVQVGRTIEYAQPPRFPFLYKLFFGTALASWLGIATPLNAQVNKQNIKTELNPKKDTTKTGLGNVNIGCSLHISEKERNDTTQHFHMGGRIDATQYVVDGIIVKQTNTKDSSIVNAIKKFFGFDNYLPFVRAKYENLPKPEQPEFQAPKFKERY